ncbi:hypothetical protein [Mycolicibacter sinensis]|uniref:Uncharacterized protein n=1 Tax=Mycolicibacter sinensis (strain JDM601) TaxID=875328 RepID=A0A1A2E2Y0_MYCSD|nr:hypothetical protein [Mycolicibacter sinensis]OBF98878.1 hypothetical protein A5772_13605 [Mycolicibacter sinensis]OBG00915.1 hypothetical protein A5771_17770 [Mycolicibacter sinensis]
MRRAVNDLLDWHGLPLPDGGRIGYQDILAKVHRSDLVSSQWERVTYTSLWNHAKRHYDHDAVTAYWATRMDKELSDTLTRPSWTS